MGIYTNDVDLEQDLWGGQYLNDSRSFTMNPLQHSQSIPSPNEIILEEEDENADDVSY